MYLHNTIRKYTLSLLDFFNDLKIQYTDSKGNMVTKLIPVVYRNKEKNEMMDKSFAQEISGNMNILPRGTLNLIQMAKSSDRNTSKYGKFAFYREDKDLEYMWQPVAYDFTYDLSIICRGMSEACQIIEQIAPKFNPNICIDVYDVDNLDEPTRVPVQLQDINPEFLGLEEYSMNVVRVNIMLLLFGWLYPPIKSHRKIKDFEMQLGVPKKEKTILNFDVIDGELQQPPRISESKINDDFYFKLVDLIKNENKITVLYETNSTLKPSIEFSSDDCDIISSSDNYCIIQNNSIFSDCEINCVAKLYDVVLTISKIFEV